MTEINTIEEVDALILSLCRKWTRSSEVYGALMARGVRRVRVQTRLGQLRKRGKIEGRGEGRLTEIRATARKASKVAPPAPAPAKKTSPAPEVGPARGAEDELVTVAVKLPRAARLGLDIAARPGGEDALLSLLDATDLARLARVARAIEGEAVSLPGEAPRHRLRKGEDEEA